MMLMMQILVVAGIGIVIYAVFGIFNSDKHHPPEKKKNIASDLPAPDSAKDQKIQRLESQLAKVEFQLEQAQVISAQGAANAKTDKTKEDEFVSELKRREEWVSKAEAELTKIKGENTELNNRFAVKEKELEEEFTKNVNLTRELREIKAALEAKEMACRLKEDQLQAQKHQIESQAKSISEHAQAIAEFNRKEKISEWVPKAEFNQLNEEYTKLEKELEVSQERLKSFAIEIAHLRKAQEKNSPPVQEVKLPEPPAAPAQGKSLLDILDPAMEKPAPEGSDKKPEDSPPEGAK